MAVTRAAMSATPRSDACAHACTSPCRACMCVRALYVGQCGQAGGASGKGQGMFRTSRPISDALQPAAGSPCTSNASLRAGSPNHAIRPCHPTMPSNHAIHPALFISLQLRHPTMPSIQPFSPPFNYAHPKPLSPEASALFEKQKGHLPCAPESSVMVFDPLSTTLLQLPTSRSSGCPSASASSAMPHFLLAPYAGGGRPMSSHFSLLAPSRGLVLWNST